MEDAQSETIRRKVWEWYTGSVYNRLQPNGAIVLMNHRMHEDDLTGKLLAEMANGGDQWTIVRLPAIDDDGNALWPEAYPIDALRRIQRNTLPRFWSGLYQQNPTPDEGEYFKRPWFKFYDKLPQTLRYYGASDYATKDGQGDYTVHVVIGVDTHDAPTLSTCGVSRLRRISGSISFSIWSHAQAAEVGRGERADHQFGRPVHRKADAGTQGLLPA